jgi:hypothetical protein
MKKNRILRDAKTKFGLETNADKETVMFVSCHQSAAQYNTNGAKKFTENMATLLTIIKKIRIASTIKLTADEMW